jgi:SAM-dependent methyltransferase
MRATTIKTYDVSADKLVKHYEGIGPREGDVILAFALAGNPENARVLEIGCGYGREARKILEHTEFYDGIDTSEKLIEFAKQRVPRGTFRVADAVSYDYPEQQYDIVFAFASLRHLDKEETETVLRKVYHALKPGGICYISLNYAPSYRETIKDDEFGIRLLYMYNPQLMQKLAGPVYKNVYESRDTIEGVEWFEIVLKKT